MRVVLIVVLVLALFVGAYLVLRQPEKSDLRKLCESQVGKAGVDPNVCAYADKAGAAAESVVGTIIGGDTNTFAGVLEDTGNADANFLPTYTRESLVAGMRRASAGAFSRTMIGKQPRGSA